MIKQVHITPTMFLNESRLLKQATSVLNAGVVDKVYVIAMYGPDLKSKEILENGIVVLRPSFPISRILMLLSWMPSYRFEKIMLAVYGLRILLIRPHFLNLHYVRLLKICFLKKILKKLKIIYEAHELETESNGLSEKDKFELKEIESKHIQLVDYTFVVSPSIEQWYRKEYGIDKIKTIMNVPLKAGSIINKDIFRKKFGLNFNDVLFIYNGALFDGRGVRLLLETFEKIDDKTNHLIFMGSGNLSDVIKDVESRNENIHFHEAVEPNQIVEYTSCADVGVSLVENKCLSYYYCLPNKVFEYLISEIPMIVSNMRDMKNFVENNKIGLVAQEYTVESVTQAVETMSLNYKNYKESLILAKEKYNWENEESKMIPVYKGLVRGVN